MLVHRSQSGFSTVELLVVLGIIALLATISFQGLLRYTAWQQFRSAESETQLLLEQARVRSLSGQANDLHGVHVSSTTITTFQGASYTAGDAGNREFVLPRAVTATTSFGSTIIFDRLTGAPSVSGDVMLSHPQYSYHATVTVSSIGIIE